MRQQRIIISTIVAILVLAGLIYGYTHSNAYMHPQVVEPPQAVEPQAQAAEPQQAKPNSGGPLVGERGFERVMESEIKSHCKDALNVDEEHDEAWEEKCEIGWRDVEVGARRMLRLPEAPAAGQPFSAQKCKERINDIVNSIPFNPPDPDAVAADGPIPERDLAYLWDMTYKQMAAVKEFQAQFPECLPYGFPVDPPRGFASLEQLQRYPPGTFRGVEPQQAPVGSGTRIGRIRDIGAEGRGQANPTDRHTGECYIVTGGDLYCPPFGAASESDCEHAVDVWFDSMPGESPLGQETLAWDASYGRRGYGSLPDWIGKHPECAMDPRKVARESESECRDAKHTWYQDAVFDDGADGKDWGFHSALWDAYYGKHGYYQSYGDWLEKHPECKAVDNEPR
jgi:hypothetical protein